MASARRSIYVTGHVRGERESAPRIPARSADGPVARTGAGPRTSGGGFRGRSGAARLTSTTGTHCGLSGCGLAGRGSRGFRRERLPSTFFLHGIHPGSGSADGGVGGRRGRGYSSAVPIWFARFTAAPGATAVVQCAVRRLYAGLEFPNPFNNATSIRYALPAAGEVDLAVQFAGAPGSPIDTGHQAAGVHEAVWMGWTKGDKRRPRAGLFLSVALPRSVNGTNWCFALKSSCEEYFVLRAWRCPRRNRFGVGTEEPELIAV